jgi:hypothetical protein
MIARRGRLKVFDDRVECGNWRIAYTDVQQAILYHYKYLFMTTTAIHLVTADGHYQFGFNPLASPADHINLDVDEKEIELTYSTFSKILRLSLIPYIAFWVWYYFIR